MIERWRSLSLARKVIYFGYIPIIAFAVVFVTTGVALIVPLTIVVIVFAVAAIAIAVVEHLRRKVTDNPDN